MVAAIGQCIKTQREEKGVTQMALAAALRKHPTKISRFETGAAKITAYDLFRIARILKQPISRFFPKGS